MAVISFSQKPEHTWHVGSWAFHQILNDVSVQYADDKELVEKFEQAKLHSGLMLELLDPSFARRIEAAIQDVVNGILAGTIPSGLTEQPYGDQRTVQEYMESLRELMQILHASKVLN